MSVISKDFCKYCKQRQRGVSYDGSGPGNFCCVCGDALTWKMISCNMPGCHHEFKEIDHVFTCSRCRHLCSVYYRETDMTICFLCNVNSDQIDFAESIRRSACCGDDPANCRHTHEEHAQFDRGLLDGELGRDKRKYGDSAAQLNYDSGYEVGESNRDDEDINPST